MTVTQDELKRVAQWVLDNAHLANPAPEPPPVVEGPLLAHGWDLELAKEKFAKLYPGVERVDCDMNDDGSWTCSSENIDKDAPPVVPDPVVPDPVIPDPPPLSLQASVVKLPVKMENDYKFNVNGHCELVSYADKDRQIQLLAFYNENRQACIAERVLGRSPFARTVNIHQALGGADLEYDNHNNLAIGVAPDGTIFVAGNMHVDPLRMAYTEKPYSLHTFVGFDRKHMPGTGSESDTDRVTYPSFFHLHGYLGMSYREQEVGGGKPRFRWVLKLFDHINRKWLHLASLNTGVNLRLYVSNIATSRDGTTIHLTGLWRDDASGGGTEHQHDYFHLYSRDGKYWFQIGENVAPRAVTLPLTWNKANGSNVPINIWDTPPSPIPNGAGSIAIDHRGYPHMLMDIRGGTLVYHWFDGAKWQEHRDVFDSADDDIFAIGDKMCAVSHKGDEIYFHVLNGHQKPSRVLLAKGFVSGDFNVSVDRGALTLGHVSLMMTKCRSHAPRTSTGRYPTDAYVLTVPFSGLFRYSEPFVYVAKG